MGLHGLAFDDVHDEDEPLHWHEFEGVTWVISGTGSFADEHGNVTTFAPGCRLQAPVGWLHRTLAGTQTRLVIGTNLPGERWTAPINKDPAERPSTLKGNHDDTREPAEHCAHRHRRAERGRGERALSVTRSWPTWVTSSRRRGATRSRWSGSSTPTSRRCGERRMADRPRAEAGRRRAPRREALRRRLRGHRSRVGAVRSLGRPTGRRRRGERCVRPLDDSRRVPRLGTTLPWSATPHHPRTRRAWGAAPPDRGDRAHEPLLEVPDRAGEARPARSRPRTSTSCCA